MLKYYVTYTNTQSLVSAKETYYTLMEALKATTECEAMGLKVQVTVKNTVTGEETILQ